MNYRRDTSFREALLFEISLFIVFVRLFLSEGHIYLQTDTHFLRLSAKYTENVTETGIIIFIFTFKLSINNTEPMC